VRNIFDRLYRRYDAWYDLHKYAYLSELEAVKKALPPKGVGLEIGVGTGRFAAPLGIKMGVDPSSKMIALARRRCVDARIGRGENLPFKEASFDYAAIIVTLCFVKNPIKVLAEAYRVLKTRGILILGIIEKNSFWGRLCQKKRSPFYKTACFFNKKELVGLLKDAGLTDFKAYWTLSQPPDKMTRIETPKTKRTKKSSFLVIRCQKKSGRSA
jgi:ubiquinone/menaquinone biosynthesis C-methylase UbiE